MIFFSPIRLLLLFGLLSLLGILALTKLRIDLLPQAGGAHLSVSYQTSPSSPELNERRYTNILENAFSQLGDIENIRSVSTQSTGTIDINFSSGSDVQYKAFEVSMILSRIYPQLPQGMSYPAIGTISAAQKMETESIKVLMVTGPDDPPVIKERTQQLIKKTFYAIQEINELEFSQTPTLIASVLLDEQKCRVLGVSSDQIYRSIQSTLKVSFPGTVQHGDEQLFVSAVMGSTDIEALKELIITSDSGQTIRLRDIAEVKIQQQSAEEYYRINGQTGINVSLYPKPGSNSVHLGKQIDLAIKQINEQLPVGYRLKTVYDKTAFLKAELNKNYNRTLLSIGILILFILLAYRTWQSPVILLGGLIVNLLIAALLAVLFRVNINLYTIAGVTLSFGMMVDNAIVMLDHYKRYSNLKILPAMCGATLCILSAVSMVYLLPKEQAASFRDFASIVILSLASSIFVALCFTPALAQILPKGKLKPIRFSKFKSKYKYFLLYERWIIFLSRYRYLVILFFAIVLGSSFLLFVNNVGSRAGVRKPDQTKLYLTCNMSDGHTPAQMNATFRPVENWLRQRNGLDQFITYIESGQYGGIEIFIKENLAHTNYPANLKEALIERCENSSGVSWHVFGIGPHYNSESDTRQASYSIQLTGYNYPQLIAQTEQLKRILQKNSRVSSINLNEHYDFRDRDLTTSYFALDRKALWQRKMDYADLGEVFDEARSGQNAVGNVSESGQLFPLFLYKGDKAGANVYDFLNLIRPVINGMPLSLSAIGQIQVEPGSNALYRLNRQYVRVVSWNYSGESAFGARFQEETLKELNRHLPVGYTARRHEMNFSQPPAYNPIWLLVIMVALNFIISCVIFENIRQPLCLICLVPLSFIGLFLVLALSEMSIDQGGYAAFVMLGGLVVNAGIFLINDYNQLRTGKKSDYRAAARVFYSRGRPIILTIISSCCGLLPFIIDGRDEVFWYCFSFGTLSGLLGCLFVLFTFLPAVLLPWAKPGKY